MEGKYRLATLGCKVNQYESQQIREALESRGLRPARTDEVADLAVVNTCAVTAQAMRENRRTIRKVSGGGRTQVFVVGCGASADADRLSRLEGVAAVVGHAGDAIATLRSFLTPQNPVRPPKLGKTRAAGRTPDLDVADPPNGSTPDSDPRASESIFSRSLPIVKADRSFFGRIDSFAGHQRAFLKVQDGCDAHCTYCIIPRLRGRPRSKPIEAVVDEARGLVLNGYRGIVLTGIFLGAYGRETAVRRRFSRRPSPLVELVRTLAGVDGLQRLRLSSLEPGDVDDALLEVLATHDNCVPHLHLPLQSGSAAILRRMNRQYSRDAFVDMIERVRGALDRPAISTDIIVGFPGETDADFEASVETARFAEFCKIHVFPFSPREGTAAARWDRGSVSPRIIRERSRRLADVDQECSHRFRQRFLGEIERVIVEPARAGLNDSTGSELRKGRCDRYYDIHFAADGSVATGDLVRVCIEQVTATRTLAALVPVAHRGLGLRVLDRRSASAPQRR